MAKKYPGLYLYFDWLKGLTQLPPEDGMKIIANLYYYAKDGCEPEPLDNFAYNLLQEMYLDALKRSQACAESGRRGGLKSHGKFVPAADPYEDCITPEEELEGLEREIRSLLRQRQRILDTVGKEVGAEA